MLRGPRSLVLRARRLRREMSLPEVLLWQRLRQRPGGLKFRKQHPGGFFVLDFFCFEAKLCIEVDGEAHSRGDQPAFDEARDAWLQLHGIATLRIAAVDVLRNLEAVVIHIVETARSRIPPPQGEVAARSADGGAAARTEPAADARLPLQQPSAGPPPRAGEEL